MEPLIKNALNKGHNINNLRAKEKFQCTKINRDFPIVLANTLLNSNKGQPLNEGQNGQKKMGPKRVRYSEVPL